MNQPLSQLLLDIRLQISHFIVIIDPVDHKIWVPGRLSLCVEQVVEDLEALLAKVVAEKLEGHQGLVMAQGLGEESQA
jgi:hypothetical protein